MTGQHHREGITIAKLMRMFPNDDKARKWLEAQIWPDGPRCSHCGSANVQCGVPHPSMTHRCRDCQKMFSLKTGTVMQSSKLGYQTWAIAIYQAATNIKGISSMKLHRDLGITQKSAWHLAHRIRKAFEAGDLKLAGAVEVDETFMGGKRKNMHNAKRKQLSGRGTAGKVAVGGAKARSGQVVAHKVPKTDAVTLKRFVRDHVEPGSTIYTDEAKGYEGMTDYQHENVVHSAGQYVKGQAHTNGIESFWAMLKRAYHGTFHWFSAKHMDRYVAAFAGRATIRPFHTADQMAWIARRMSGKRLRYRDLIA